MRTLSNSALTTFWRCQREYWYAYVQLIKPKEDGQALAIGTAFHDWVETGADHSADHPVLAPMMIAYETFYGCRQISWLVVAEMVLEAPMMNPDTGRQSRTFRKAGKVDGVVERDVGLLLHELKTTSFDPKGIEAGLRHGTQVHTYGGLWLQNYPTEALGGYLADIVVKPRHKPHKGEQILEYAERVAAIMLETPEKYLHRETIPFSKVMVARTDRLYWDTATAISQCDRTKYVACRGPHCVSVYGGCKYRGLCWYADHEGYRIAEHAHEELSIKE